MLFHAKNHTLEIGDTRMDYVSFGKGGMAAQYLAINHPDLVRRLVLGVTLSRTNETVREVVEGWIKMSEKREYDAMVTDMLRKMYSQSYLRKYSWLLPVVSKISKPKDFGHFIISVPQSSMR